MNVIKAAMCGYSLNSEDRKGYRRWVLTQNIYWDWTLAIDEDIPNITMAGSNEK
jgi:hypothetical protein